MDESEWTDDQRAAIDSFAAFLEAAAATIQVGAEIAGYGKYIEGVAIAVHPAIGELLAKRAAEREAEQMAAESMDEVLGEFAKLLGGAS